MMRINVELILQNGLPVLQNADREWQIAVQQRNPRTTLELRYTVDEIDRNFDYIEIVVFNQSSLATDVMKWNCRPNGTGDVRSFTSSFGWVPKQQGRYIVAVFAGSSDITEVESTAERLTVQYY